MMNNYITTEDYQQQQYVSDPSYSSLTGGSLPSNQNVGYDDNGLDQDDNDYGIEGDGNGNGGECYFVHKHNPQNDKRPYKSIYKVGVLAIRGEEAAYREFNSTFNAYLSKVAGSKFDPPIQFEMKAWNFTDAFTDSENASVDFIYANPSLFSCIESEYEARSLVSQVSKRKIGNQTYLLNQFAGVIIARADNGAGGRSDEDAHRHCSETGDPRLQQLAGKRAKAQGRDQPHAGHV